MQAARAFDRRNTVTLAASALVRIERESVTA
jgi:hypothetical protein